MNGGNKQRKECAGVRVRLGAGQLCKGKPMCDVPHAVESLRKLELRRWVPYRGSGTSLRKTNNE